MRIQIKMSVRNFMNPLEAGLLVYIEEPLHELLLPTASA
jgi:hypothetical protein